MARVYPLMLAAASCLMLTGCGSDLPSVSGKVTMDGQPLDGAVVVFNPNGSGQVATGVTNSSGNFTMGSRNPGDGVHPGSYKVTITRTAEPIKPTPYFGDVMAQKYAKQAAGEAAPSKQDAKNMAKEELALSRKKRRATLPMYQDPAKTPLTAEVPAQRDYKFELKSEGS